LTQFFKNPYGKSTSTRETVRERTRKGERLPQAENIHFGERERETLFLLDCRREEDET
jgi:hypothetical protein